MRALFTRLFSRPVDERSNVTRLGSLVGGRPVPPSPVAEPIEDPLLGDPVAHAVKRDMESGSHREIASLMATCSDPQDRTFYVEVLSDIQAGKWAADWLRQSPDVPAALLMGGALAVRQAWRIRGSGYAKTVRPEAWEQFFDHLELAEGLLKRSAQLAPSDAAPWFVLMQASVGLQHGHAETARRFAEVCARAPYHRAAHSRMLQQFCKKWSGSHEKMFEFARSSSDLAPPGSQVHALIPEAHIEWWLDEDNNPDQKIRRPDPYFSSREVHDELHAAAQRCFDPHAGPATLDSVRSHNYFALAYWLAGDHERARHHLLSTGNWVTVYPWCIFGGLKVFALARHECGLAAAGRVAA